MRTNKQDQLACFLSVIKLDHDSDVITGFIGIILSMLVTAMGDHLDVDIPQLPIAAVAYGAYTHLSLRSF